jgi:hypothetical protein
MLKKILSLIFAVGVTAILFSTNGFAQNDKKVSTFAQDYVISAKAGSVNYVEGAVNVTRKLGKSGVLLKKDNLEIGDKVSTGADGKAEILLNPGSYIRLAANSEFEFVTTSLDDLKLKLTRGSAILEVFADRKFTVGIATSDAQFYAVDSGIYRVDALSGGTSRFEVWEGKARVGESNENIVNEGRQITISGGQTIVAKFDRGEKDSLEIWSKTRAKELAKINSRLEQRSLQASLINSYGSNGWNLYDSFGLWVFDPRFSSFCFFPFAYGWSSPYGHYFGWSMWDMRMPQYIYNAPNVANNNGNNTGGSGVGNNNNGGANNGPGTVRDNTPPFQQMEDSGGVRPSRKNDPTNLDVNPFPASSNPPPVIIVPQTTRTDSKKP